MRTFPEGVRGSSSASTMTSGVFCLAAPAAATWALACSMSKVNPGRATTTAQIYRWSIATNGTQTWQSMGCWRQSGITLGSLGSTATPGDMSNIAFPLFGLITRSVFDI